VDKGTRTLTNHRTYDTLGVPLVTTTPVSCTSKMSPTPELRKAAKNFGRHLATRATISSLVVGALAGAGCGASSNFGDPVASTETSTSIEHDLTVGSQGNEVVVLHDYLTQFGYFPNAELQKEYPAWRPIVPEAPAANDVFDEKTSEAVLRLQANMSIPTTGIVDEATRAIVRAPRCGVPDGISRPDPSDKFDVDDWKWGHTIITYRVLNTVAAISMGELTNAIAGAFASWSNQTTIIPRFVDPSTPGLEDIAIQFGSVDAGPIFTLQNGKCLISQRADHQKLGSNSRSIAQGIYRHNVVTLDSTERWSVGSTSCSWDVRDTLTHEIGHALGLDHSGVKSASMYPSPQNGFPQRVLQTGDNVAISSLYDTFHKVTAIFAAHARDIGVGKDGSVWIINSTPWGDGFRVAKYNGFNQFVESTGGAVRVAVDPDGVPWATTADGSIYRGTTNDPATASWDFQQGFAFDIGVGYNGDVWAVGTNNVVFKWNGKMNLEAAWTPDHNLRNAVKVSVGPSGEPYILDSNSLFWRYSNNDPMTGTWISIPGQSNDLAIGPGNPDDIVASGATVARSGYLWSLGRVTSGVNVAVWDEQGGTTFGAPPAIAKTEWAPPGGSRPSTWGQFSNVAVGPTGNVWFINGSGDVWTTTN
jgi:hypothetical protein